MSFESVRLLLSPSRTRAAVWFVCWLAVWTGSGPALAGGETGQQSGTIADRHYYVQYVQSLFLTESVYPMDTGQIQLTFRPVYAAGDTSSAMLGEFSVDYGITDRLQVGLDGTGYAVRFHNDGRRAHGIGDVSISAQYSWMNISGSPFHLAADASLGLPLGDAAQELGDGRFEYQGGLAGAWDLPWRIGGQLTARVSVGLFSVADSGGGATSHGEGSFSAGLIVPAGALLFTLEAAWKTDRWSGGDSGEILIAPGLTWVIDQDLQFGLAASAGLDSSHRDWQVLGLVVYAFDLFGG